MRRRSSQSAAPKGRSAVSQQRAVPRGACLPFGLRDEMKRRSFIKDFECKECVLNAFLELTFEWKWRRRYEVLLTHFPRAMSVQLSDFAWPEPCLKRCALRMDSVGASQRLLSACAGSLAVSFIVTPLDVAKESLQKETFKMKLKLN